MAIDRLIGVYRANGGLRGEARYLIDHYLRGDSCSLCDITHSPIRRKKAWDDQVASLGIPFDLLHLNELDPRLAQFVGDRAACVIAQVGSDLQMIMDNDDLASIDGSVGEFFNLLRRRLQRTDRTGTFDLLPLRPARAPWRRDFTCDHNARVAALGHRRGRVRGRAGHRRWCAGDDHDLDSS